MKIITLHKDYKAEYISKYGHHFNKKLCDFAVSLMSKSVNGIEEKLEPMTKSQLDALLANNGVIIKYTNNYDYVYVANMCRADFLGKSIPDNLYMLLYVKDMIEDIDAYDGYIFNRWNTDMKHMNIEIDWEKMI